jgi:hypothetical protein
MRPTVHSESGPCIASTQFCSCPRSSVSGLDYTYIYIDLPSFPSARDYLLIDSPSLLHTKLVLTESFFRRHKDGIKRSFQRSSFLHAHWGVHFEVCTVNSQAC